MNCFKLDEEIQLLIELNQMSFCAFPFHQLFLSENDAYYPFNPFLVPIN